MKKDGDVVLADPSAAALVTKKKKERRARSWIVVDSTGQGTIFDADKQSIIHRAHIHGRDLRILDPFLSYPSAILGRDRAIVLNFEHIKAIITCEEVFLRDPLDENVMPVVDELQRRLAHVKANPKAQVDENDYTYEQNDVEAGEEDESPFEFRALEVALEAICSFLAGRTTELENAAYPALDELTCKISSYNLDRVRKLKSTMARLTARVQKVRDEFERLLDDDDDLSHLCLSRKVATSSSPVSGSGDANWFSPSPTLGSKISAASRAGVAAFHEDNNNIEELEMLLEAYFVQITQTLSKLAMLREYVDDTEDYLTIQLERYRNQLIQLEIFLNAGICCISIISVVAGIFGVNIQYTWNNGYGYMLKWVLIATGLLAGSVFALIMAYARHKGLAEF